MSKAPDVQVATIERTLIDAINRPELCGGISDLMDILNRARSKVNIDAIMEYLPTYRSKAVIQRVGYLLDTFGFKLKPSDKERLLSWCRGSKTYLLSANKIAPTSTSIFKRLATCGKRRLASCPNNQNSRNKHDIRKAS